MSFFLFGMPPPGPFSIYKTKRNEGRGGGREDLDYILTYLRLNVLECVPPLPCLKYIKGTVGVISSIYPLHL